ncbi:hypothetical protein [Clostridium tyrobutyricum]|uniref:hypothetical protein n=1 Tax=Clostridium tyrobutyricum TaxID=1519 RepID=UPI001C38AE88|nr:hypothetical protein [Clostridium tyrobutyricum]MBV4428856.1 hypothetical protein [Clostridium tyrobutyricum]MBV4444845.1 hypothetical protein [Clostridium tyrobutyricum]
MSGNFDYIKSLKNQSQKKKSVTITIDESVFDKISEIADKLEISKNQIISDISGKFVKDYTKAENPSYYIINSNNYYMPEGHLHMLLGNKVSAWGDTKSTIEGLNPGDYVFVYMNKTGIIASGTVTSNFMVNDYSLVKHIDHAQDNKIEYDVWDEYFVNVEFDKRCLKYDEVSKGYVIKQDEVVTASEFNNKVSKQPFNRTKLFLSKVEGEKLKELFLQQ